jgi:hypothetical protein
MRNVAEMGWFERIGVMNKATKHPYFVVRGAAAGQGH